MNTSTLVVKEPNSGILILDKSKSKELVIKRGRFIEKQDKISHSLFDDHNKFYKRIYNLEYINKKIYWFNINGKADSRHGYHVGFNNFEYNKFLWLQGNHWFQKEENIRYCINIIFLILGLVLGFLK